MGVFVITSFSASQSENNYTISLQGQDKMCRLNGTVNGALSAEHDFGTIEEALADGTITLTKLPLKTIIRSAIKQYAQEPEENIIINDLDDENSYELWEYDAVDPFYYFRTKDNKIKYVTWDSTVYLYDEKGSRLSITLNDLKEEDLYGLYSLNDDYNVEKPWFRLSSSGELFQIIKIQKGEIAGYHTTKLVYNSDLILNAGDTITSMLDKLCTMLGSYEYFYTVNGKFVFQKKKDYVSSLFSTSTGALQAPVMLNNFYSYRFDDDTKFTAKSFSPDIKSIKNDFAVLGTKELATGATAVIHARCAIDTRPKSYQPIRSKVNKNTFAKDDGNWIDEYTSDEYDWRELIYQMAYDYQQLHEQDAFQRRLEEKNSWAVNGVTGYESYYTDLFSFWRDLYFVPAGDTQLEDFYPKGDKYQYWNKDVNLNPDDLKFWFNFLDTDGELKKYSVKNIGQRLKVDNNKSVTGLFNMETPEVLLKTPEDNDLVKKANSSYTIINIDKTSADNAFYRSSQGLCALEVINDLLVNGTQAAETISLTCLPIYDLDVNTRIYIKDKGDYTVNSISMGLDINGKMTISATKIIEQWM